MEKSMPKRGVRADLLRVLTRNANTAVHPEDIAKETGWNAKQIKNAANQMIYLQNHGTKNWGGHLEALMRGGPWIYHTGPATTKIEKKEKRLFEEVQTTKSGSIIVTDGDGTLYVLKELDI